MIISVYVDEKTERRLRKISEATGRSIEDLAYAATSDQAATYFRDKDDPAHE